MTDSCTVITSVPKIKLDDPKSRKAVFLNPAREKFSKTRVDNCVIKGTIAADWVLTKIGVADIIVELKGKDVAHAVEQVIATAEYWRKNGLCNNKMSALIVCNEFPKTTTKVQKAQVRMMKEFKSPLHVATGDREYIFDRVLSFKGPN